MVFAKNLITTFVLCALVAVALSQVAQGGPHQNQGAQGGQGGQGRNRRQVAQEGSSQGGASQGGASQGGVSQGGASQEGTNQGGADQNGANQSGANSVPQTGANQDGTNQGGDEANENQSIEIGLGNKNWTTCDVTTTPRISCYDCNTRLVCKPIVGGLLITCRNPFRPHCNNGTCSSIPSAECA